MLWVFIFIAAAGLAILLFRTSRVRQVERAVSDEVIGPIEVCEELLEALRRRNSPAAAIGVAKGSGGAGRILRVRFLAGAFALEFPPIPTGQEARERQILELAGELFLPNEFQVTEDGQKIVVLTSRKSASHTVPGLAAILERAYGIKPTTPLYFQLSGIPRLAISTVEAGGDATTA